MWTRLLLDSNHCGREMLQPHLRADITDVLYCHPPNSCIYKYINIHILPCSTVMCIYRYSALWPLLKSMVVVKTALPDPCFLSGHLRVFWAMLCLVSLLPLLLLVLLGLNPTAHDLTKLPAFTFTRVLHLGSGSHELTLKPPCLLRCTEASFHPIAGQINTVWNSVVFSEQDTATFYFVIIQVK